MSDTRFYIGTDIGGTFTDMVVIDSRGGLRQFKVPDDAVRPQRGRGPGLRPGRS